ncbi:MAG TPA: hypothetical protein VF132_13050 [Rudaea sp.]
MATRVAAWRALRCVSHFLFPQLVLLARAGIPAHSVVPAKRGIRLRNSTETLDFPLVRTPALAEQRAARRSRLGHHGWDDRV